MLRHAVVTAVLLAGAVAAAASDTSAGAVIAAKPCTAYAFWTDKGCRTWSSPCTQRVPSSHIETLSVRKPGTSNFTVVATGKICAGPPDFRDGPHATPTDAECRERCLKGEHGIHGGGHGPSPTPLPQGPVDLTIHTDSVTHQISPLAMGCHSDSGCESIGTTRPYLAQLRPDDVWLWVCRRAPGPRLLLADDCGLFVQRHRLPRWALERGSFCHCD
jgi:hypothetical protein